MQHNYFRLRKLIISILDAGLILIAIHLTFVFNQSGVNSHTVFIDDAIALLWVPMLAVIVFPVCFKMMNLYNFSKSLLSMLIRTALGITLGVMFFANMFFFMKIYVISRTCMLFFATLTYLFIFTQRLIVKEYYRKLAKDRNLARRVLVVGNETLYQNFMESMDCLDDIPLKVIGFVPIKRNQGKLRCIDQIGEIEDLLEIAKDNQIDEVVFVVDKYSLVRSFKYCYKLQEMGITVDILSDQFHTDEMKISTGRIRGLNVITAHSVAINDYQMVLKRMLDIAGGLIGCLITLMLVLILGPLIYLEDRGPIFFKQERVGKNGRVFKMYKFRSMYIDAEARKEELMAFNEMQGHMFKMKNDPRVTKMGAFIRKTSLDEFPQFINVLMGDMSLVGTRPPTVNEVKEYENCHRKRLSIKPGITGNWQVSGRSDTTDFEDVVRLDTEYISNWNIWKDIHILTKTVAVVLFSRGAA